MVTFYPWVDHAVPDVSGLTAREPKPLPPPLKINGVLLVGDMSSEELHLASADDMKNAEKAIDELSKNKQDKLSEERLANIDAVPDKADKSELRYKLEDIQPDGNNAFNLKDRTSNRVVPTVNETKEWVWSDGETGTPVFSDGYWTVPDASFQYDGPVAGSASDTVITFPLTDKKTFTYFGNHFDDETWIMYAILRESVSGDEFYAQFLEEDWNMYIGPFEYRGNTYIPDTRIGYDESEQEHTFTATYVKSEHVVTLTTTYWPAITLAMPPEEVGFARDLIVRLDLSNAVGVPPVEFTGGTFEADGGEMPELVTGINLLSFTETAQGKIGIGYKEVEPLAAQGGS